VPTIASTIPFEPHPARDSILGEAHARPFFRLEAPARVLALAFVRGKDSPETLRERLDNFARAHGAAPAPIGAKHHRMMLPQGLFRWEEHTEFTSYVFMLSGEAARLDLSGGEVLRLIALPEQPGPHLVSVDLSVVSESEGEAALSHVKSGVVSLSSFEGGRARVASDFTPDEAGFVRFVIVNRELSDRGLGALARNVMEVEFYRMLALLGLPEGCGLVAGQAESTAVIFARLRDLPHKDVMRVLAAVMADSLEAGSALVEAVGAHLQVDLHKTWTPDDAFFDLLRDKSVVNAMVAEIAGKSVANGNVAATGKVQKQIVRDCLAGTNGREKVTGWLPRWLEFPVRTYRKYGGSQTAAHWKSVKNLFGG